ncbi:hypothetical protein D3C84_936660 [compost metagenome]
MCSAVLRCWAARQLCRWGYINIATLLLIKSYDYIAAAFQHVDSFGAIPFVLINNHILCFEFAFVAVMSAEMSRVSVSAFLSEPG